MQSSAYPAEAQELPEWRTVSTIDPNSGECHEYNEYKVLCHSNGCVY